MATAPAKGAARSAKRATPDFAYTTSTVDGVPVLWTKTPGLKRLALTFRVGFADEALHERGFSHICEHLALRQFRDETFAYNGFVEATRTVFYAQGTDKQLLHFARGVTEALSELPKTDFASERRVLRAESATRPLSDVDWLLRVRYGSRGPGVGGYPEYGHYEDNFDSALAWSQTFFTGANAVAWCSGPPPRGLKFALEAGKRREPVAEFEALDEERPLFARHNGGLALGFELPNEPADVLAAFVLESRLRSRLRHESNTSYSVLTNHVRLGLDTNHLSMHADVAPREGQAAVDDLVRVLDELQEAGHTRAELNTFFALSEQANLHDGAELNFLDRSSQRILYGGRAYPRKTWEAKVRRVSASAVADAISRIRDDVIYLVPDDAHPPAGVAPVRQDSAGKVNGRTFTPTNGSEGLLTVGVDGVTYANKGQQFTVLSDDAQIRFTWADRSRAVVGTDGVMVGLSPHEWLESEDALVSVDSTFEHVPTVCIGRRRSLPTGIRPKTARELMTQGFDHNETQRTQRQLSKKELFQLNAAIGIGGISFLGACMATMFTFQFSETNALRALYSTLAIVFGVATVLVWRQIHRVSRERVYRNVWLLDAARLHVSKGRVPDDLPTSTAYIVGGLLLGWLASRSMLSEWAQRESAEELEEFADGRLSGPDLLREWDGVLASDMLNERGAKFCSWYLSVGQKRFEADLRATRADEPSVYHLPDRPDVQAEFNRRADASYAQWSKRRGRRLRVG